MKRLAWLCFLISALLPPASLVHAVGCDTLLTIAGIPLSSGDAPNDVPPLTGQLDTPAGVAVDPAGDVFFADTSNNVVRELVEATQEMVIVAGDGIQGDSGNNGPATAAGLDYPMGVCVDGAGDIYITEFSGSCVREVVKATGNIVLIAGNGTNAYSGDNGPAVSAALDGPETAILDGTGNLYISDQYNYVIRKVVLSTGIITTVAGSGTIGYTGDNGPALSATLDRPVGLAMDSAGDLYISDYGNDAIRMVSAASGIISTVAGNGTSGYSGDNGPAVDAELAQPQDIVLDPAGDLYITDYSNAVIREVVQSTGIISSVIGIPSSPGYSGNGGPANLAQLNGPFGIAINASGGIVLSDLGNDVIREVTCVGTPTPTATASVFVTATRTPSMTPSATVTVTSSASPSGTVTVTATPFQSSTITPTFTVTATFTPVPPTFSLSPHWPNPNPAGSAGVWLPYTVSDDALVNVWIYDISGELVRSWSSDPQWVPAGNHERPWDERNSSGKMVASGVFFVRIDARPADAAGSQQEAWEKCAVAR
jgi:sugar lactone lactonase YvrE